VQVAVLGLRRGHRIPYNKIIDDGSVMIVPPMWANARDFLDSVVPQFRTDPWAGSKTLVLVFSEKAGMTPILREVTEPYAVPLFPTGGYTSETFLWDAAQLVRRPWHTEIVVLPVGDLDNSGLDIVRAAEKRLREMVAPLKVTFVRIAVLPEHIARYNLPTRPQKIDKRGDINVEAAVDLDAMDPDVVQDLLRKALRRYMPDSRLAAHDAADESVREKLAALADEFEE
jgi:hypothetical protein